jgi:Tol biopolymer transport system component
MDPARGTADLWLMDLMRGTTSRFTSDPGWEDQALWSPDGSRIVFSSDGDWYQKRSDNGGSEEMVLKSEEAEKLANQQKLASDWSRDGRFISYDEGFPNRDIWVLPLFGDHKPTSSLKTQFSESHGKFSPDGKWMAYVSDESGKSEVYVQPFSGSGSKVKVSSEGGEWPVWRRDGRELFFLNGDTLMSATVGVTASLEVGSPKPLFQVQIINDPAHRHRGRYAASSDGQRFLVLIKVADPKPVAINVVYNWTAALRH